jgi:V8-like Glu-specific endopeptidase/GH25 family lysozyme M1 (1,4-beta-N-acetylmuramidase)
MPLSEAYDPSRFTPSTRVMEEMYRSSDLFNEGLSSFEYPLYHATDEELEHFLGGLIHSATKAVGGITKAVGSVAKSAGKVLSSVQKVIPSQVLTYGLGWTPMGMAVRAGMGALTAAADGKNVFQSAMRSLANDPVSRFYVDTAMATARGENVLKAAQQATQAGIGDLRQSLQFGAMVAPFVPGLGTGVAAALGAANALAAGQPITEALISAARSAIPGGAIAQMAFDTAMSVARGKNLSDALLNSARAQLPGGPAAQAAFDAAVALAKGKKIQDAAFAAAGRLLPPSPYAADALSFVKKVANGENIQRAALSTVGNAVLSRIERQAGPILSRTNPPLPWPAVRRELPEISFEQGGSGWRPAPTRQKVSDPSAIPFRWICKVSVFKRGNYDGGGSGVLISDRHVLTAAHVVYDAVRDPVQYSLGVRIGFDSDQMSIKKVDISSQYSSGSLDYDYAIITLSRPISDKRFSQLGGKPLCFWGSSTCGAGTKAVPVQPRSLVIQNAFTAGFPKNKGGNEMWSFSGLIATATDQSPLMVFTGETTEGQSGSPLWIKQNGEFNLVGIVVARGNVNRVLRLSWSMVAELNGWMLQAEKQTPEASVSYELIPEAPALSPTRFAQLARSGQATTAIAEAVKSGQSDIDRLTNMVFYARHPEVGSRKIRPDERALGQEWLQIRDTVVRPALARISPGTASPTPTVVQPDNQPLLLGIDTYGLDGNKVRDWVAAKNQVPISFAIFRSNYGTFKDTTYAKEWPRIKSAGLVGGAYLFLRFPHPDADQKYGPCPAPAKQAQALIDTVGKIDPSDLPPTLDVEFPGGRAKTGMSADQCLNHVRIAWKVLKDYYRAAPIIYTSARVWQEDLADRKASDLTESPLWLAYYGPFKKGPAIFGKTVTRINPPVPPPWGDKTNWWIHQYQGDALRLPGFATGNLDMNRFNALVKGTSGDRVRWVQRRLGITQNGVFDAAMETALARFQQGRNLPAYPVVDPRTFAHLCWSNP